MQPKIFNDINFIKFWPPQVEILRATHHYPIHPGHFIPNILDISVSHICHMLLYCPLLREDRKEPYTHVKDTVIRYIGADIWKQSFSVPETLVQLIIDCTRFSHMFSDEEALDSVERLSRNLCYELHIKRLSLLRAQNWLVVGDILRTPYWPKISSLRFFRDFHTPTFNLSRVRGCSFWEEAYTNQKKLAGRWFKGKGKDDEEWNWIEGHDKIND